MDNPSQAQPVELTGNNVLYLTGASNTYMDVPNHTVTGLTEFTAEATVMIASEHNYYNRPIFEWGNDSPFLGISSGKLIWYGKITGPDLPLNQWNHIAFIKTETHLKLYLNGEVVGKKEFTGTFTNSGLGIGKHQGDSELKGAIDDVKIWDKALTAEQLLENKGKVLTGQEITL